MGWMLEKHRDTATLTVQGELSAEELYRLAEAAKQTADMLDIEYGSVGCLLFPESDFATVSRHLSQGGTHTIRLHADDTIYLDREKAERLIELLQRGLDDLPSSGGAQR